MKKCSILLFVYNPNRDFLIKQLKSIDNQTYKNIEVIIHDDCPSNHVDEKLLKKYLKKTKYRLLPYMKKNIGYEKAFERLCKSVNHKGFISFCDQDDIWDKKKIEVMINELESQNMYLAVCDRKLMDENDVVYCESVTHTSHRKADNWIDASNIAKYTPFQTYAIGMAVVADLQFVKRCLPFVGAHDKWISCCAAIENKMIKVDKPLVKYRRHKNNVSGVFNGINCKQDYINQRIISHDIIVKKLSEKYGEYKGSKEVKELSLARINKNIFKMFRFRELNEKNTIIEILIMIMPDIIFKNLIKIIKKKR